MCINYHIMRMEITCIGVITFKELRFGYGAAIFPPPLVVLPPACLFFKDPPRLTPPPALFLAPLPEVDILVGLVPLQ